MARQRPVSQQAVLSALTEAAILLVATVGPDIDSEQTIRELFADVAPLTRSVGFRIPAGGLSCATGIGSRLWDRLF